MVISAELDDRNRSALIHNVENYGLRHRHGDDYRSKLMNVENDRRCIVSARSLGKSGLCHCQQQSSPLPAAGIAAGGQASSSTCTKLVCTPNRTVSTPAGCSSDCTAMGTWSIGLGSTLGQRSSFTQDGSVGVFRCCRQRRTDDMKN